MKIVRMLHPFCIPVFGYIAGGDEIGMPDNIADAMVASGYAKFMQAEPLAEVTGPAGGGPIRIELEFVEPPTESPTESRKSKRKSWSAAEDTLTEENN